MRVETTYRFIITLLLMNFMAQDSSGQFLDPREAKEHFKKGNYKAAMGVYKKLLQRDRSNVEFNHKLAICYLRTNISRKLAIPYLEKCVKLPNTDPEVYFDLGMAYQYALKFKDAIAAFNKYKEFENAERADMVDRKIETCNNGKRLVRDKQAVVFEHLGSTINSKYPDYS